MRFIDYLRITVLLLGLTSIALLIVAAGAIARNPSTLMEAFAAAWLAISMILGLWIGRGANVMESIRVLLSRSRPEPAFPIIEPGAVMITRHWPILLIATIAAVSSIWTPSVAITSAGYGLLWSLAWRKQALAVEAIEERDSVHFWLVKTSALKHPKLVRVPGM